MLLTAGLATATAISTEAPPAEAGSRIANPSEAPNPPITIELEELWRVGSDSDDSGPIFGVVTGLAFAADGSIYIVDNQLSQITVISSEGVFLRTIGREGEGPGDLRRPGHAYLSASGELRVPNNRHGRLERFSPSGEYVGTITTVADSNGIVPMFRDIKAADGHVVALGVVRENPTAVIPGVRTEVRRIYAMDDKTRELARYHETSFSGDDAHPVWSERPTIYDGRWDLGANGRVFVASSSANYEVTVFGPSGAVDYVITRDYGHRTRSKAEKQRVYDWANVNPNGNLPGTEFKIDDCDRDIMSLYSRDDGTLWVLTSRGFYDRPPGSVGVFDVFDSGGHYLRETTLMGSADPARDRLHFRGDRLYALTCIKAAIANLVRGDNDSVFNESCEGPMELVCYRIASE